MKREEGTDRKKWSKTRKQEDGEGTENETMIVGRERRSE